VAPRCFLTRRNADRATDSGVAEGEVGGGGRDGGRGCSADCQGGDCTPVCTPMNDEHHTRGVTSKSTQTKRTCAFWGGCLCLRVRRLICTTTISAVSPKAESVHKQRRTYGETCASFETQRVVVVGQQRVGQTGPSADTGTEGRSMRPA
jgi:hypothetical protein